MESVEMRPSLDFSFSEFFRFGLFLLFFDCYSYIVNIRS